MENKIQQTDVLILGAGAAGLLCAIEAGKRGRRVLLLDHANKVGKKILMSGGGRCNFTNLHVRPECYVSHNPHFCKSALSRYTQWDFIDLVKKHRIAFHEKTLGQLFCDDKSSEIVTMLVRECEAAGVRIELNVDVENITHCETYFKVQTSRGLVSAESLVIATGGLSIPTMGASAFAYKVAEQFGLKVWPTRAGLVPLTLHIEDKEWLSPLSGVSVDTIISNENTSFREAMLITHRGLSGPAILQISSFWEPGEPLTIRMLPDADLFELLKAEQRKHPQKQLNNVLSELLPKRLVELLVTPSLAEKKLATLSHKELAQTAVTFQEWVIKPNGTEGYRTAEVTLGGVDCNALSSKTMEVNGVKALYFIGEAVDVTGWLGGYNFQWAWSSGWAAGQVV